MKNPETEIGGGLRVLSRSEFDSGPEAPSYQVVADEFGLTPDIVKHALLKAREEFRPSVTETLCGYAWNSEILSREMRDLFGP